MLPPRYSRPAMILFTLAATTLASSAYLENGLVQANSNSEEGETTSVSQSLNLTTTFPGGQGIGTASSQASGAMNGQIQLNTSASISSSLSQGASSGTADVRVTDELTLNVPGYSVGTVLFAKVSVDVDGSLSGGSSGDATRLAIAQVSGPLETWAQQSGNTGGPIVFDPDGEAIFTIPLKVGQPEEDNLALTVNVATNTFRNPDADPEDSYSASAGATLLFELGTIQDIFTEAGATVYEWTITAESGLDYGSGDPAPPPPPDPVETTLKISPSELTPGHLTLAWTANPNANLILQTSRDTRSWFQDSIIQTPSDSIEIDPSENRAKYFRIITVNPTGPLSTPELRLSRSASNGHLRFSWNTEASETYRLLSSPSLDPMAFEEIYRISGATGPVSFETPPDGPKRFYRLLNSFTFP